MRRGLTWIDRLNFDIAQQWMKRASPRMNHTWYFYFPRRARIASSPLQYGQPERTRPRF
jgi:hypothetical protein